MFNDGNATEKEVALYELLYSRVAALNKKRRGIDALSVEGHIQDLLVDPTKKIMAQFVDGQVEDGAEKPQPKPHPDYPEKVDVLQHFRLFLAEVAILPLNKRTQPAAKPSRPTMDNLTAEEITTAICKWKQEKLKAHAVWQDLPKYWTDDRLKFAQQALDFLRQHVIRNADVLVSTLTNSHPRRFANTSRQMPSAVSFTSQMRPSLL